MSLIMQNAIDGVRHQIGLYVDAMMVDDFELAKEHWNAAELLEDFAHEYIPIEGEL